MGKNFIGSRFNMIRECFSNLLSFAWNFALYTCIVAYCISRLAIFALSLYCLLSLPDSAYKAIDWTNYIAHFS